MVPADSPDDLKDAPFLRSIPKQDPFVVPEGFFERFPHIVQAKIVHEQRNVLRGFWSSFAVPAISFGAAAVLLLVWWMAPVPVSELSGTVPELDEHAELAVLDLTESDLLYALLDSAATPMGTVDLQMDTEELIAYLENEDLPLEYLIEQP